MSDGRLTVADRNSGLQQTAVAHAQPEFAILRGMAPDVTFASERDDAIMRSLGVLYLIKDEVSSFLGEEKGEFMAVIPLGYPKRGHAGPRKKALEYVVRDLGSAGEDD